MDDVLLTVQVVSAGTFLGFLAQLAAYRLLPLESSSSEVFGVLRVFIVGTVFIVLFCAQHVIDNRHLRANLEDKDFMDKAMHKAKEKLDLEIKKEKKG